MIDWVDVMDGGLQWFQWNEFVSRLPGEETNADGCETPAAENGRSGGRGSLLAGRSLGTGPTLYLCCLSVCVELGPTSQSLPIKSRLGWQELVWQGAHTVFACMHSSSLQLTPVLLISLHLTPGHLISLHLTPSHSISPQLSSSHSSSPQLTSSHSSSSFLFPFQGSWMMSGALCWLPALCSSSSATGCQFVTLLTRSLKYLRISYFVLHVGVTLCN